MFIRPRAITRDVSSSSLQVSVVVETLAALKALSSTPDAVMVKDRAAVGDGGGGVFVFRTGDQSANVTADTEEGVWAAPDSAPTGASGAWERLYDGPLNALWFGASPSNTAAQNVTAFTAAFAAGTGKDIFVPEGYYLIDGTLPILDGTRVFGAGVYDIYNPTTTGTCFGIKHTSGPAIRGTQGMVVEGINFWWPDQVTTSPPTVYDYAIEADHSTPDDNIAGFRVLNCTFYNAYNAINLGGDYVDLNGLTHMVQIADCRGCIINTGIYQEGCLVEGTIDECSFSPVFWPASIGGAVRLWMRSTGNAIYHLAATQALQINGGTWFGHRCGILCSNPSVSIANGGVGFFSASNLCLDGMRYCILTTDNVGLLGANFTGCTFLASDQFNLYNDCRVFYSNDCQNAEIINFTGCSFLGTYGTHVEIARPTSTAFGRYNFSGCTFFSANAGAAAGTFSNILCNDSRATINVTGAEVYNAVTPAQIVCFKMTSVRSLMLDGVNIFDTASKPFEVTAASQSPKISNIYSQSSVASTWPANTSFSVASASSITLPEWDFPLIRVTGTTNITGIAVSWPGRVVVLKFTSAGCTVTDGSNLSLSGSFTSAAADATLTLSCDGTTWHEVSRANSTDITIASGTLTASAPALNITQTWNNAGVVFNSFSINNTDTASNASSAFGSFRVGGAAKFSFLKNGTLLNTGNLGLGYGVSTDTVTLNLGNTRTGDGISNIDLVSDTTYTSGGLRIVRGAGANGASTITHRGTGNFALTASEAATFQLTLNSVSALTATSTAITSGVPVSTPATTTSSAGLRLPHGTAPTAPVDGDMWTTTDGLYVRINGTTAGPISQTVENLAALKALTSRPESVVVETGQAAGLWQWEAGSSTTADDALVVQCTSGTAGRYKRVYDGDMYATWFGASPSATGEENVVAIKALIVASAAARCRGVVSTGTYEVSGEIDTVSNLHLVFDNAVLKPVGWSVSGSIITNLVTSASSATIQENIQIEGLQMDFSAYPASPIGTAQSGSTTSTITLAAGDPATSATIVGRFIRLLAGTGAGAAVYAVSAYNEGTKVATISSTWSGASPDNTTIYQWGWNDNAIGFVAGATDVRVLRTRVTNLPSDMLNNGGSKGINFEQGVEGGLIDDVFVEGAGLGCVAAVFVQGRSGVWGNGSERNSNLIQVKNVFARNCGAAVAIGGADTSEAPTGDPDQQLVIVDGVTFHNCGHMPNRFVITDQQKGAPILLFRAQNVVIKNVTGYNDSTYPETSPGYPTDYSARVGYGLTGPIGAVVWGWGRNITIDGVTYNGDADSLVRINRARVIGEDAAAQGTAGEVTNVISFKVTGLRHWGTVDNVVAVDSTVSMRVLNANLLLNVEAEPGTVTTGIVSNMNGYTNSRLDIYDRATDTRIRATADEINDAGNTVASYTAGRVSELNLNAGYLLGGTWAVPGAIGSTTPSSGSFTTVTASDDITAAAGSTTTPSIKSPTDETGFSFTSAALMNYVNAGTLRTQFSGALVRHSSVVGVVWSSGAAGLAADVGLSRISANVLGVGTGAVGNTAGTLRAGALAANGSDFTITAANAVSPTSPDRTITISYGGTTYYLHAKTTND